MGHAAAFFPSLQVRAGLRSLGRACAALAPRRRARAARLPISSLPSSSTAG
jgi:hypothetical protein